MNVKGTQRSPLARTLFFPLLLTFLFSSLTSCGNPNKSLDSANSSDPLNSSAEQVSSKIIVGDIDWTDVASLSYNDPARIRSRAVGYISIPTQDDNRCTAFLVASNIVMTNWHCFPEKSHAENARFYPEFERGSDRRDYLQTTSYDCSDLILTNEKLDFALLRCEGSPGSQYGVLELEGSDNSTGLSEPVYVIHQNCDYWNESDCPPIKLYSPGRIIEPDTDADEEVRDRDVFYDSDTLGGSSGSPVFSKRTNKVIAIHHFGHSRQFRGPGRGTSNSGIPLHLIGDYLRTHHPRINLNFIY